MRKYQYLLYDRYASKLLSVSMRYAGSRAEAEEILQEGLIRVYKNISSFRMNGNNSAYYWMKRIIINTALNYLRDNKKYRFLESVEKMDENISDTNAEEYPEGIEDVNEIMKIIQLLPTGYKTVFTLYSIEEYSHYEISEMLGISVNTSKTQLMKARRAILQKIKETKKEYYLKKIC